MKVSVDHDTYLVVADGTMEGLEEFREAYPDRYLNVGIAEANATSIAAGLSYAGKEVYLWNCSTFLLYRPFDQVRMDLAYARTRVRLIGSSSGMTRSTSGIAHISIEDMAMMRALPNMTVVSPGDEHELRSLLDTTAQIDGPVYMRLGLENEPLPVVHESAADVSFGRLLPVTTGSDASLIATGILLPQARAWVDELAEAGWNVALYSAPTIKPFDDGAVAALAQRGTPIITLEDHSVIGGLGGAVAEAIAGSGHGVPFLRVGYPDAYPYVVGSFDYMSTHLGVPTARDLDTWLREQASRAGRG